MATDRKAKIVAAAGPTRSGGPNKIIIAAVVAILAIAGVVGGTILSQQETTSPGGSATPTTLLAGTQGVHANPGVTTAAGAPVVQVYEDFQCSHCHDLERAIGPTLHELATTGKIQLAYHPMSFMDENTGNTASRRASMGAVCAADAGKFGEFHDAVFATVPADTQAGWSDGELETIATESGITGEALTTWQTCTREKRYASYLDGRNTQAAKEVPNMPGTPTVLINGTLIDVRAIATPELLTAAVAAATK